MLILKMFTGIIRHFGKIVYLYKNDLQIQIENLETRPRIGDSIAVNGICLTVVLIQGNVFSFYVMQETVDCTVFSMWTVRQTVNIEFAAISGSTLDGHITTGHITHTAKVVDIIDNKFVFEISEPIQGLIYKKGSVCIDGVSLTVVDVFSSRFSVCIIPHTMANTIFHLYTIGTKVNIEVDNKSMITQTDSVLCDEHGMELAMQEALKGRYTAPPNPWVGCIIIQNSTKKIVARGYHHTPGTPHAEIHALNNFDLLDIPTECTMYVTLEPCSHYGRTGPCTERLLQYNKIITRIVIGMTDPDEKVRSTGIGILKQHFEVTVMNSKKVLEFYRGYILNRITGLPYITFKIATTFDHNTVIDNKYITCKHALEDVHILRSKTDIVLTTTKTVQDDNPKLNIRDSLGNEIQRKPVIIFGTTNVELSSIQSDKIIQVKSVEELKSSLSGYFECLVEAGPTVYKTLLAENMIQEVVHYHTSAIGGTNKWELEGNFKPMSSEVVKNSSQTIKTVYILDFTI